MASESSKEELVQLIKRRICGFFLFEPKNWGSFRSLMAWNEWYENKRSIGAIAGIAVAIVFAWRLLRSPQRRPPNRPPPTATSSSSGIAPHSSAPPGVLPSPSSEDVRAQNVVDEFFQPVKVILGFHRFLCQSYAMMLCNANYFFLVQPTLGQIVRQKLSQGRKVCCSFVMGMENEQL